MQATSHGAGPEISDFQDQLPPDGDGELSRVGHRDREGARAADDANLRITLSIWFTTAGAGLDTAHQGLVSNLKKAMEKPTPLAYKVAAVWAQQTGRIDEAFTLIGKAGALAPNDPEVLVSKALLLNTQGRAEQAEAELQRAIRLRRSATARMAVMVDKSVARLGVFADPGL